MYLMTTIPTKPGNKLIGHYSEDKDLQKYRIMIVDDQKRTRNSLRDLLHSWEQAGEIQEGVNGLEAIGLAEVFQPEIILMDVRMCKMDAIQAARVIKQQAPQVKVIILSMYPDFDIEAMDANADAFVSKGESPERLLGIIQMLAAGIETGEN